MGSGITGTGIDALQRWQRRLETAPQVLEMVSANMAEEALSLVAQGFEEETDPYRTPWQKLLRRKGRILQDTGRMRSSWHRQRVDGSGFTIAAGVNYARFHQQGSQALVLRRLLPARKMVPDPGPLPQGWQDNLVAAAEEVLVDHFTER